MTFMTLIIQMWMIKRMLWILKQGDGTFSVALKANIPALWPYAGLSGAVEEAPVHSLHISEGADEEPAAQLIEKPQGYKPLYCPWHGRVPQDTPLQRDRAHVLGSRMANAGSERWNTMEFYLHSTQDTDKHRMVGWRYFFWAVKEKKNSKRSLHKTVWHLKTY